MRQEDNLNWGDNAKASRVAAPSVVYHYTTTTGLLGIVNTRRIWATDLAYLNDAAELSYGIDLVIETANTLLSSKAAFENVRTSSVLYTSILQYTFDAIRQMLSTCIACFCVEGDLLSQWRGYAVAGGYSIGFDGAKIRASTSDTLALPLMPVIYDLTQQKKAVESITEQALAQSIELILELARTMDMSFSNDRGQPQIPKGAEDALQKGLASLTQNHFLSLFTLCAQLKDSAFREEREWRLCDLVSIEQGNIDFRAGHLGLIPYTQIPLSSDTTLPIKEIIIGPGPEPELRVAAVRSMLTRRGYTNDIEIRPSTIPFRPSRQ